MARRPKTDAAEPTPTIHELTPFQKSLLEQTSRKVTVRIDGETLDLEMGELIARKLLQVAASGSPHALGQVSRNVNEAQRIEQARIQQDFEKGEQIKAHYTRKLEAAVRAGAGAIWVVPHPDDILVDRKFGWRLRVGAPFEAGELKPIRQKIAIRDALLLQSILDERLAKVAHADNDERPAVEQAGSTSYILALMMNDALFERFRLSDKEILFQVLRLERRTKRELLKAAFQAWQVTGSPKRRGWTIPPWSEVGGHVVETIRILQDVCDGYGRGEFTNEAALADKIQRRLASVTNKAHHG